MIFCFYFFFVCVHQIGSFYRHIHWLHLQEKRKFAIIHYEYNWVIKTSLLDFVSRLICLNVNTFLSSRWNMKRLNEAFAKLGYTNYRVTPIPIPDLYYDFWAIANLLFRFWCVSWPTCSFQETYLFAMRIMFNRTRMSRRNEVILADTECRGEN